MLSVDTLMACIHAQKNDITVIYIVTHLHKQSRRYNLRITNDTTLVCTGNYIVRNYEVPTSNIIVYVHFDGKWQNLFTKDRVFNNLNDAKEALRVTNFNDTII